MIFQEVRQVGIVVHYQNTVRGRVEIVLIRNLFIVIVAYQFVQICLRLADNFFGLLLQWQFKEESCTCFLIVAGTDRTTISSTRILE